MGFTINDWARRFWTRSDLTSSVVHLTRPQGKLSAVDVLIKILCEQRIIASDPSRAFMIGSRGATCFQNTPIYSICQNLQFESDYRQAKNIQSVRYSGVGLGFSVGHAYYKGCRPVIYEDKEIAKRILPPDEYWRIVHFNPNDPARPVDWTHEREWRFPGDFTFSLDHTNIFLSGPNEYHEFVQKAKAIHQKDIMHEIRSIVCLEAMFC